MPRITEIKMELTTLSGEWGSKVAPTTNQSRHFKATLKADEMICLVSVSPYSS